MTGWVAGKAGASHFLDEGASEVFRRLATRTERALVLIALVVSVLTWRYWLATRPLPIEADGHPAPAG